MAKRMKVRGRRKVNWRFVVFSALVMLVFSTVQLYIYIENNLGPRFVQVAEAQSRAYTTRAINESLSKLISDQADYDKLVVLRQGDDGRTSAGFFNMQEATRLQYAMTTRIEDLMQELSDKKLTLPFGQAMSDSVLSAMGPDIPVQIHPISSVRSNVRWETQSVGINQTVHVLYLEVDVRAEIVVPFVTKPTEIKSKVPFAYLVMVGDVPQVVFNATGQPVATGSNQIMPPIQLPDLNGGTTGAAAGRALQEAP